MNRNNILLTGFRATGKSLVGTILAEKLGSRFIDTDQQICFHQKMSINEMVATYGWERFREVEKKMLIDLLSEKNVVVAVGGGAIEHQIQWQKLRQNFFVVWLQADAETIYQRIRQDRKSEEQRPALTTNSLKQEIFELLGLRTPLYSDGADISLDTTENSPVALAEKIVTVIKEKANVTT